MNRNLTAEQIAAINKSDAEMQARMDRISAASAKAYADKIAAETAAREARIARLEATPISNCRCSMETIENSWAPCACDDDKVTA
jgi:hypothetical protein